MAIRTRPDISAFIERDELSEVFGYPWKACWPVSLAQQVCSAACSIFSRRPPVEFFPRPFAKQFGLAILGASGYNEIRGGVRGILWQRRHWYAYHRTYRRNRMERQFVEAITLRATMRGKPAHVGRQFAGVSAFESA